MPPRTWMRRVLPVLAALTLGAAPPARLVDALGDPLPPGAVARYGTTRLRHGMRIDSFQFSADGTRLLSLGEFDLRIWDTATGRELARRALKSPFVRTTSAAMTPDGGLCVVDGGGVDYFATPTASRRRIEFEGDVEPDSTRLSPDGKLFALGQRDGVRLLEVPSGKQKAHLRGAEGEPEGRFGVYALTFSRDGKLLAGVLGDNRVIVWNVEKPRPLRVFPAGAPADGSHSLAISPDGQLLAALISGHSPRLLSMKDGGEVAGFKPPAAPINTVAFGADGTELLTFDAEGRVSRHEARTGKPISASPPLWSGSQTRVTAAFSPDGTMLAVEHGNILIVEVKSGKPVLPDLPNRSVMGEARWVRGQVVCIGIGDEVRSWDPVSGKALRSTSFERNVLNVHPDGTMVVTESGEGPAQLVDSATRQVVRRFGDADLVLAARFSPDGRAVAVFSCKKVGKTATASFDLFETATGRKLRTLKATPVPDAPGVSFAFSPRGDALAVLDEDEVSVHEEKTGRLRQALRVTRAQDAAFSPDGRLLAVRTSDGVVAVHRLGEGRLAFEVVVQASPRRHPPIDKAETMLPYTFGPLTFSPDGRALAAGSGAHVRLWDMTGRPLAVFRGHEDAVTGLAFSPDGGRLASTSADGTGLVWRTDSLPESPPR